MNSKNTPLVAIVGETASGKTRLAIDIAKELNGEIICADSWTVRKGLDIGTAKPTIEEQEEVEHHLIDIVEPLDEFNAVKYKELATDCISSISSRGKLPIIVGGTGLYIDSVIYDYSFSPVAESYQRDALNNKSLDELVSLAKEKRLDLSRVDIRNKRRVVRLIESGGHKPTKAKLRPNTVVIGISVDREELKRRISQRVNNMIEQGLEAEVRSLLKSYSWDQEILKGVGYRQWKEYFEGGQSLEETKKQIISSTINLAKRQRTWFKRNNSIHWYTQPVNLEDIVELITTKLSI